MRTLSPRELLYEWSTSRDVLARTLGTSPHLAAIPGGSLSQSVLTAVSEAGYKAVMTSEPRAGRRTAPGIEIYDRYTVWGSTTTKRVHGYVTQDLLSCIRLRAEWEVKKAMKDLSPRLYEAGRRLRAEL